MASPTDPKIQTEQKMVRTQRKPPFMMLLPLVYAPVLPLIRISLRHNPVVRDRLFYGVLAGAFAHGLYLISISTYNTMCLYPYRRPTYHIINEEILRSFWSYFLDRSSLQHVFVSNN
ncbi:hypothetical protein DM860_004168 [Cuscuta australis]|uniref:Uncharacterized protein n=1 Tax=Cuscuta australis TaxID=267555 RepID=A0A328CW50_9ASTE|nr:hypothetical protein DM860_004168 [Cuscuta australis]